MDRDIAIPVHYKLTKEKTLFRWISTIANWIKTKRKPRFQEDYFSGMYILASQEKDLVGLLVGLKKKEDNVIFRALENCFTGRDMATELVFQHKLSPEGYEKLKDVFLRFKDEIMAA